MVKLVTRIKWQASHGFMIYLDSVAPDQPTHWYSLTRSYMDLTFSDLLSRAFYRRLCNSKLDLHILILRWGTGLSAYDLGCKEQRTIYIRAVWSERFTIHRLNNLAPDANENARRLVRVRNTHYIIRYTVEYGTHSNLLTDNVAL